jgi:hypothetical protein
MSEHFSMVLDWFFSSLRVLLHAHSFISLKMDYFKVAYDWRGGNALDSMDYEDSAHVTGTSAGSSFGGGSAGGAGGGGGRDAIKFMGFDKKDMISRAVEGVDIEWVLEQLIAASTLLGDYDLPRSRLHVLENLARVQDMLGNNAEAGAARWEIFLTLQRVEKCGLTTHWCPRPPLKLPSEADFMTVLRKTMALPPPTHWSSERQFYKHMVTVLTVCAKRFKDAKLTFLAERAIYSLIDCYRRENFDENESLPLIAKAYQELHDLYQRASVGSTTFAMGTFYRVLFLGQGK